MNSNGNNDMLRQALQRRAERMAPAKGWEERVLGEMAAPQRRFRLKWLSTAAAAAAAIAIAFTLDMPTDMPSDMPSEPTAAIAPTGAPSLTIAEAPAPIKIETAVKPKAAPVIITVESEDMEDAALLAKYDALEIEVEDELSVSQEIEELLYAYK